LLFATLVALALAFAARAEAFVYWANTGDDFNGVRIGRANLDGTGANQNFLTTADGPYGVAVDAAHLYWANVVGGTIARANLDGTGVDPSLVALPGTNTPRGVAVDGAHVYWANPDGHTIGRANLDGTSVKQDFITIPNAKSPYGVAVDAAHIFWANNDGTIGRAKLDGTGIFGALIQGGTPSSLAVDATHVYWGNGGGTTIGRANLDGSGVNQSFITAASSPNGVAVDGAHVYWANVYQVPGTQEFPGTIGRANLDGTGANQSLITGANNPKGVAVDALPLPPSNDFSFGRVKKNKRKGTAKLPAEVPGPGSLTLTGKGIKKTSKDASAVGEVKLPVKSKGKKEKKLKRKGEAKVKPEVTFTPEGGTANTESKKVKLVKR
jgi:virginiamycin B lyase